MLDMVFSFGWMASDAFARDGEGLLEGADVAHLVGQQQNQFGVEQLALLVAEVAVGLDQGFVEIVAGREVAEVALAGFGQVRLELQGHGGLLGVRVQAATASVAGRWAVVEAMSCAVARASALRTATTSKRRQRAATCWSGRSR